MKEEHTDTRRKITFFTLFISIAVVAADSVETDKQVLLNLKSHLEQQNLVNRGRYSSWNNTNPCNWAGIFCNLNNSRVTGINLSDDNISGRIFPNFSALTELTYLDLSKNTISGAIPNNLNRCKNLKYLNLSHNILDGELNLSGLVNLETLDLSVNRICGEIGSTFRAICSQLVVANISANNFTGRIDNCFQECWNLQYLDLSSNSFSGGLWAGISRFREFSVSENSLDGEILPLLFSKNCSLQVLDLSVNDFGGEIPGEIANCRNMTSLTLSGNNFTGKIPDQIGEMSSLEGLFLGTNNLSREIPESLLSLGSLVFLDLSNNSFDGDIQTIFGKFTGIKFLNLHGNSYSGGIYSSGILNLSSISRLDLSYNSFSGPLPDELSEMQSLEFVMLAHNQFSGIIPSKIGNLMHLQALDLSFNMLNGSIPSSIGNLKSLMWLMLANNSLTGQIPKDLGNCSSLLWLNLANNELSGKIPSELTSIGTNVMATFEANRRNARFVVGSGECLSMKRWIPANYPPFSFAYTILTRKSCRSIWDRLLKGYGIFPTCSSGSTVRTLQISGYVQLSGNELSGEVPKEIGKMQNFTMLNFGCNKLYGELPKEISQLPLVVLNISANKFSGEIPGEIGNLKCLQNLDLSLNNFSGKFPTSFDNLTDLNKFNISYNPLLSGEIPSSGQFATFDKESYLGDPLLHLPNFFNTTPPDSQNSPKSDQSAKGSRRFSGVFRFLALLLAFLVCGLFSLLVCLLVATNRAKEPQGYLSEDQSNPKSLESSSYQCSSPWLSDSVKVIRLNKTAFTHADILRATANFSEERIIGKGGYGTVYKGALPDGRQVAVKKLLREGIEGEKDFRAEMEVLSGNGFEWPHPNLVTLYGWCLDGSEKILVYEYIEGGSLEDFIADKLSLTWRRRVDIATDVARALVFLHHECYPAIVHRDVKASNVLLDKNGKARVTDFGLARVVNIGDTHVSTMVAGTIGYVAPEYGQTWKATTKGDVYSFGVLVMELATGRRAVDGGEECLVEWAKRVAGNGTRKLGLSRAVIPVMFFGSGLAEGAEEMSELLRIGLKCTNEAPHARPDMKEVLYMLIKISASKGYYSHSSSPPSS